MKVILMQDVAKIGRRHQVVEVPDGYGQNQLIPKGWAKPATPQNLKEVQKIKAGNEAVAMKNEEKFFKAVELLKGKVVNIKGQKSDNGHLFAAIKADLIKEAMGSEGIAVDSNMIKIHSPIKTTGNHSISLVLGQHQADVIINIE